AARGPAGRQLPAAAAGFPRPPEKEARPPAARCNGARRECARARDRTTPVWPRSRGIPVLSLDGTGRLGKRNNERDRRETTPPRPCRRQTMPTAAKRNGARGVLFPSVGSTHVLQGAHQAAEDGANNVRHDADAKGN